MSMSEAVLQDSVQKVFLECEFLLKSCLEALNDRESRLSSWEAQVEIYKSALCAMAGLQLHYGRLAGYYRQTLAALAEELEAGADPEADISAYPHDGSGAALDKRLQDGRARLELAEKFFLLCQESAENLLAQLARLEKAQSA